MSMTRDELLRCLDDPTALNEQTSGELREILDEYPYFQGAHLLYVLNLQKGNNFRFSSQLKTCAVYATDRSILYHLLNPGPKKVERAESPLISATKLIETHNTHLMDFDPFDKPYLLEEGENESVKQLSELANEIVHLSANTEIEKGTEQKNDLIDRFIKENPPFNVKQTGDSGTGKRIDQLIDRVGENDEFITETLARIYMKQGLYQKSINAFKKLGLKYPEKSVYFALQIEEVTKLINK